MKKNIHENLFTLIQELLICMRAFQKDAIFCEDVTFVQFNILHIVQKQSSMEMKLLRDSLDVEKSTLTRLVEPLIKKNMITKMTDGKSSILSITDQGKQTHETIWKCITNQFDFALNKIDKNEQDEIISGINGFTKLMTNCCTVCK